MCVFSLTEQTAGTNGLYYKTACIHRFYNTNSLTLFSCINNTHQKYSQYTMHGRVNNVKKGAHISAQWYTYFCTSNREDIVAGRITELAVISRVLSIQVHGWFELRSDTTVSTRSQLKEKKNKQKFSCLKSFPALWENAAKMFDICCYLSFLFVYYWEILYSIRLHLFPERFLTSLG